MSSFPATSDYALTKPAPAGYSPPCSVLVVSNHPLFRRGVAHAFELDAGFELIGEAANGQDAISRALAQRPDIVLLDLDIEDTSAARIVKDLKETDLDVLVIALTVSADERNLAAALRSGADGYLLKNIESQTLLAQLRTATKGRIVLDQSLAGTLVDKLCGDNHIPHITLTARERDVLRLITQGLCNKMIARKLEISSGTVKVHVKHLLSKVKLRSRLQLAVWAIRGGIVD